MAAVTPGEDRTRLLCRMQARRLFRRMMTAMGVEPIGRWWHGLDAMIASAVGRYRGCTHTKACATG